MKLKLLTVVIAFLLSVTAIACSSDKSSSNLNSSSQSSNVISDMNVSTVSSSTTIITPGNSTIENSKTAAPSKNDNLTISLDEICDILSSKNTEVIESLKLSDSDKIKSLNDEKFYVPVFLCKKSGIMIGFNGAQFDPIDKVRQLDESPIFIMPATGTTISFDKNISFTVGDDIKQFKAKFGEGIADKDGNLQGDKEVSFITYDMGNLKIRFTSRNGDDFNQYDVSISKP